MAVAIALTSHNEAKNLELSLAIQTNVLDLYNTPYLSALDFWHSLVWNFQFDALDIFLVWTEFLLPV
jgi:hypothetical protein